MHRVDVCRVLVSGAHIPLVGTACVGVVVDESPFCVH